MTVIAKRMPPKQFKEFQLLTSIRFACLMAMEHQNPMQSQRVQKRIGELNNYLQLQQPSQHFVDKYCNQVGKLGMEFALGVCQTTNKAAVCRLSELTAEQKKQVAA